MRQTAIHTFMNTKVLAGAFAAIALASCTGNKKTAAVSVAQGTATYADIEGQWIIENIVFNDSTYVRPAEETPGVSQHITFYADSTYSIMTNCNSISGSYSISGDSLRLNDGAMTEMACDNMATEDALRKILPCIATVDVVNDSVVRLNGDQDAQYIVLHKTAGIK